jgi:hypothetical protein
MRFWQALNGRATAHADTIPLASHWPKQFAEQIRVRGSSDIFEKFENRIWFSRRIFLIRGYQVVLQLYLFLDNSGN